jgi:hypothetical protein
LPATLDFKRCTGEHLAATRDIPTMWHHRIPVFRANGAQRRLGSMWQVHGALLRGSSAARAAHRWQASSTSVSGDGPVMHV